MEKINNLATALPATTVRGNYADQQPNISQDLVSTDALTDKHSLSNDEYLYSLDYSSENWETLLNQAQTAFQARIVRRAQTEAMVAPSVFEQNVLFCDVELTYERLGWEIPRQAGWQKVSRWNESFGFLNEDDSSFQHQLDQPRIDKDGDPVKYESIRGKGSQVYMPSVPIDIRRKMSEIWGVEVPLTGSFWHWYQTSEEARKLPLVVTEGGWKCLSILSLGIPAISLYGCSAGFQKRESKYDARQLCVALDELAYKRQVCIAFDQDEKPKTRRKVNANIKILGEALSAKATVSVARWEHEQGKGADDFIAAQGGEAFFKVLDNAQDFSAWKKLGTIELSKRILAEAAKLEADIVANTRWVSDCNFPLPKPGEALLFDSAMGTGKTIAFKKLDKALRERYPDLQITDLIGHRNNLLQQSSSPKRLDLDHISKLEAGAFTQSRIDATDRLAYCVDSLVRRYDRLIRACQSGQKILLVIDELDAVLTHMLTATTIAPRRRMQIIGQLATLFQLIGDGHGFVIGGEANLSGLAVRALKEWSQGNLKITVCRNEYKPAQWQVFDYAMGNAAKNKAGAIVLAEQFLKEGKKVLLLSSGQETAEQFEVLLNGYGKVIRIDSTTSSEPEIQALIADADVELPKQAPQLLIATPTIESGVSIDIDYFDEVILYGCYLEPRALLQMLGRNRKPVPRHLFVADTSEQKGKLDPQKLLRKWEADTQKAIEAHGLVSPREINAICTAKELTAEFMARAEAGAIRLRHTLIELLKKDGHIVSVGKKPNIEGVAERVKEAKETLADQFVELWASLNDSQITPKQARELLRQELPYKDYLTAQKALQRDKFGDLVDDEAWVHSYWAQGRVSRLMQRSIDTAALYAHPEMAKEQDKQAIQRQIETTGTVWTPSFASKEAVVNLLRAVQFDQILSLPDGAKLHATHWAIDFVFRQAQKHAAEVKEVLGLSITDKTKPMEFINDVLSRRLGATLVCQQIRLPGINVTPNSPNELLKGVSGDINSDSTESPTKKRGRGRPKKEGESKRVKVFEITHFPFRQEMIDAIAAHHAKQAEEAEEVIVGGEVPGQLVEVGGESWKVFSATASTLKLFPAEIENPSAQDAITFSRAEIAQWEAEQAPQEVAA